MVDVLLQRRTIRERPLTGLMHAFVFWGFVAFAGYTLTEFLFGLGIVDSDARGMVSCLPARAHAVRPARSSSASSTC